MDLELLLSEHTVDKKVSAFLKARINIRPQFWINDHPKEGQRSLNAIVASVEEIEQKRIQIYKGKVYRDLDTGCMFAVHREDKTDDIVLINIPTKEKGKNGKS